MAISQELWSLPPDPRWFLMEELLLDMRGMWFGAVARPLGCGRLLVEPEGELIAQVDGSPAEGDSLVAEACRRRAYVVTTSFSRPADLPRRLKANGFHIVQRQGTYIYDPDHGEPEVARRGLLAWLRRPLPLELEAIGQEDLPAWNRVCYEAFGSRGLTEGQSLAEKERAFLAMGERAVWYMARAAGEPAGTAILYVGERVAQVLAVGTLPRFRNRGIAACLTRAAVADFRMAAGLAPPGATPPFLFLDTRPGSQAERIYLRLGFRPAYIRSVYAP